MDPTLVFLERVRAQPGFSYATELLLLSQRYSKLPLVEAVIQKKILSKDDACRCWADAMQVAYVDPFASVVTEAAVAKLPAEVAEKARAIGLYIFGGALTVAMADPLDAELVRRLTLVAQMPVSPVFGLPREIDDAIAVHYATEKTIEETLNDLERSNLFEQADLPDDRLEILAKNNGVAQTLSEIVYFALRERATDIHLESHAAKARVRFRVDGNLREMLTYATKFHRALVSLLKILCNLNIANTRFPQDGRFSLSIGSATAQFRVSTFPAIHGEKVVVRVLAMPGKKTMISLDQMMMSDTVLQPFKRAIQSPNGIIFVTGPTGSGKTTTLYAALEEINSPELNITTIEDPVEIQLENITQGQVNFHIDLKFSTLLRSLMRQDPDVILVGEIRDLETAKIATEAALTGHIVFATLHTNTAPQAIVRLIELGVEPYMVAPSVIGVLAQRLAARICVDCKEAYTPSREVLGKFFEDADHADVQFHRGRGCPACRHTGFKGRVAFHELVLITEEIRTLISERRSVQEIARAAEKVGYRSLRYDGLKKVLLGLTTIEEIENSTSFEWETAGS